MNSACFVVDDDQLPLDDDGGVHASAATPLSDQWQGLRLRRTNETRSVLALGELSWKLPRRRFRRARCVARWVVVPRPAITTRTFARKGGSLVADQDLHEQLGRIVNASGFPFRMAVRTQHQPDVRHPSLEGVVSAEHAWTHPKTAEHGYVDLVLQHEHYAIFRTAIECKRIKDHGKWVFPVLPGQRGQRAKNFRLF